MSENQRMLLEMLACVAEALGPELREQVAFVGGCTTALLITDEVVLEDIRFTDDVDLVIQLAGMAQWVRLSAKLRELGFKDDIQSGINCRMLLGELKVDFMPSDGNILGYTNTWYEEGLQHTNEHILPNGMNIRVFSPPYFLATKLEAFNGRGNDDRLQSKDIEDICNLINGREDLAGEIAQASDELQEFVKVELSAHMRHPDFEYVIQSATHGDFERARLLYTQIVFITES